MSAKPNPKPVSNLNLNPDLDPGLQCAYAGLWVVLSVHAHTPCAAGSQLCRVQHNVGMRTASPVQKSFRSALVSVGLPTPEQSSDRIPPLHVLSIVAGARRMGHPGISLTCTGQVRLSTFAAHSASRAAHMGGGHEVNMTAAVPPVQMHCGGERPRVPHDLGWGGCADEVAVHGSGETPTQH